MKRAMKRKRKKKESLAKPREEVVQFIKSLLAGERRTIYTPMNHHLMGDKA